MTTDTTRRPGGVTFVVVLAIISAVFVVVNGLFVMLDADTLKLQLLSGMSEDELLWAGVITIVIGVVGILLASALGRGSRAVRILFAIWIAFQIAAGLHSIVNHNAEQAGTGVVPVVFGIVILCVLFGAKADAFFEGERR